MFKISFLSLYLLLLVSKVNKVLLILEFTTDCVFKESIKNNSLEKSFSWNSEDVSARQKKVKN